MQANVDYYRFIDSATQYNLYWLFSNYATKKEGWVFSGRAGSAMEFPAGIISKDATIVTYISGGVKLTDINWFLPTYIKYYSVLVKALLTNLELPETIKIISPVHVNGNHFICLVTEIEVNKGAFQNFINTYNLRPTSTYHERELTETNNPKKREYHKKYTALLRAILEKIAETASISKADRRPLNFIKDNTRIHQYYMDSFNSESTFEQFKNSAIEFDRLNSDRVSRTVINCANQVGSTCGEHAVTNGFFLAVHGGVPQSDFSCKLRDFTWSFLEADEFTQETDISAYDVSGLYKEINSDVTDNQLEPDAQEPQVDSLAAEHAEVKLEPKAAASHNNRSYSAIPKAAIMSGACATLLFLSLHFLGVTAKIGLFTALTSVTGTVGAVVISSALVAISAAVICGVIASLFRTGQMPTDVISCSNNKRAAKSSSKVSDSTTCHRSLVFSSQPSDALEPQHNVSTSTSEQRTQERVVRSRG